MNERIRELAKQAGLYEKSTTIKIPGTHSPEMYPRFLSAMESHAAYERFAKLIVEECINIVDNAEGGGNQWDSAVQQIRQDLKKHFK